MIGKITEKIMLKHVERKLGKYDIKLMHFIPGRIRLQSSTWKQNVLLINTIIAKLKEQILVYDVQFTQATGSLLITYDASHVSDMKELESWFYIVDEVYQKEFIL
ncbi:HMA2 domain-containing protein [Peribacillus sp. NPDC096448]|uniref:HMA2 domain-containing protein n=1 Tax=Peribacillus sp. NPDC096448 TaxID=3364395 RepID=UPI00380B22DB